MLAIGALHVSEHMFARRAYDTAVLLLAEVKIRGDLLANGISDINHSMKLTALYRKTRPSASGLFKQTYYVHSTGLLVTMKVVHSALSINFPLQVL